MNDEEASSRTQSPHDETVPRIRTLWYEGKLHFSLIDIVAYLKVSKKPARSYWAQLKDQVQNKGFRDALTRTVKLPLKAAVSASERPIAQIGKPCCDRRDRFRPQRRSRSRQGWRAVVVPTARL
jgi:hypothetical protein